MNIFKSFTFLLLFAFAINQAKGQIIPNGSFENWSLQTGVEKPNDWFVSQELDCTPNSSKKTTDKADSNYALVLESANCRLSGGLHEGFAVASFPITGKPLYLNGFYKSFRVSTDSSLIKITIQSTGSIIGEGSFAIYDTKNTYTPFYIPIKYNNTSDIPDAVDIQIFSDKIGFVSLGNKLWIDKLYFSQSTGIASDSYTINHYSLFPNPATNSIHLNITSNFIGRRYSLSNQLGQEVLNGIVLDETNKIVIADLPKGIYFLQIDTAYGQITKVVKQ
jgi:hypothetical protein